MSNEQHKPEERTEEIPAEAREEILAEAREEILEEVREEARKETREEIEEEVDSFLKSIGDIVEIHARNPEVSNAQFLLALRGFVGFIIRMPQLKAKLNAKYRDQA
jgi:vacuolar-type H+-ATPase subunit E/Vma4